MKIERELTNDVSNWLDSKDNSDQHILKGAKLLLRINRNIIFFNNISRAPRKFEQRLRYELGKIADARAKEKAIEETRAELKAMEPHILQIEKGIQSPKSVFQRGKRIDHESLPEEIKKLWVENDTIRLRMRECHLRLRMIDKDNSSCPDNDRYPFAKELVRLDKKYHENWYRYDHYGRAVPDDINTRRAKSTKALRIIALRKGAFKKEPSQKLKEEIISLYNDVISPSEKLTKELKDLGII